MFFRVRSFEGYYGVRFLGFGRFRLVRVSAFRVRVFGVSTVLGFWGLWCPGFFRFRMLRAV